MCYLHTVTKTARSLPVTSEVKHPAATPISLQARKQQFVRDAIWDAAIDLFAAKGFDETTVDDIAEVAGVSRRSFFRYFSSKSDLMAHGIVSYGAALTEAIQACPRTWTPSRIFRATVLEVAKRQAAQPRTRKIMEIAGKYPGAREAQLARIAEVQDHIAAAFARHSSKKTSDDLTPQIFAALTLSILGVTFRAWFHSGQDISAAVERVFATLDHFTAEPGLKLPL